MQDSQDQYFDDPVEATPNPVKRKFSSILACLLLLVGGTYLVQTTLAANIALNSGSPLEFGQGISATTACSGATNLTITPYSSFTNASGAGAFYFSSVKVSNIPTSCYGDDFTISAYGDSSSTPLALFNGTSTSAVAYNNAGTFSRGIGSTGMTVASGSGTFTVTFTAPVAQSSNVFKLTIQSGANTPFYEVGDIGPGGGKIFYVALSPFACGPTRSASCTYLEAAPGGADPSLRWANTTYQSTTVNNATSPQTATATAIGWGYRNTRAIILQGNSDAATSAAALADSYTATVSGVTYDDWYLPSKDELNQMCKWQRGVAWVSDATVCTGGTLNSGTGAAGFVAFFYWSSSESSAANAWLQYFLNGTQYNDGKGNPNYVRPVRAF